MISVQEASSIIFSHVMKLPAVRVPLQQAVGKALAENVFADRDFPPFDRVTMDGIAIAFAPWERGVRRFFIQGIQAAGEPALKLLSDAHAVEVMTGAVMPEGADTVIRYEELRMESGEAEILSESVARGQSIHRQGQDARKGSEVIPRRTVLSPAEIALLASVGKTEVTVHECPAVAVIGSGDELVDVAETPLPHQVRRSNTYAIEAAMRDLGWPAKQFHFRDERESLREGLRKVLKGFDVIILSGGVSKGRFDFIPEVLEELGIEKLFHEVSQRPGKPFWFGVSGSGKTVFALPGNPVSTFMCFYRYIKPWLLKSLGASSAPQLAILARDFSFPPKLTCFLQVRVCNENGKIMAYPEAGGGSGDFVNLRSVSGFLELPADRSEFRAGEVFPYVAFRL